MYIVYIVFPVTYRLFFIFMCQILALIKGFNYDPTFHFHLLKLFSLWFRDFLISFKKKNSIFSMNHLLTWLVSWSYSVSYSWYVLNVFFLGCILLVFITCFLFGLYPPGIYNLFSFWVVSSWSLSSIIFLGCILLVFIVCVLFGLYPPGIYRLFSFWVECY